MKIGKDCWIGVGVVLADGSELGCDVVVGAGTVIGSDGFGFLPRQGGLTKIRQVGRVVIEDGVEIGANCCIDRATLGTTRVGMGTKIDNLVQVGHNVTIGRAVVIAAQTGIAGSTAIGDGVMLGGQVGIADHLEIGEGARVAAKSGVISNIPPGSTVAGYPAIERVRWLRANARFLKTEER